MRDGFRNHDGKPERRTIWPDTLRLDSGKEIPFRQFVDVHPARCSCPACGGDLVACGWSEVDSACWHVSFQCPDCSTSHEDTFSEVELEEYDFKLPEQSKAEADLLSMHFEVSQFIEDLRKGRIEPGYFIERS